MRKLRLFLAFTILTLSLGACSSPAGLECAPGDACHNPGPNGHNPGPNGHNPGPNG